MLKKITFIYSDIPQYNLYQPIADAAIKKGYRVEFSSHKKRKCEIGFYSDEINYPENAKFSVIMLSGLDQGRFNFSGIWINQPWNKFDLGFLPNAKYKNLWKSSSWHPYVRPKLGVYSIGWPKSDIIFNNKKKFFNFSKEIKKKYNLKKKFTIIYAPTFENSNKQLDVLDSIKELNVNLLVKHWCTNKDKVRYKDLWNNISHVNNISKKFKNVTIIDPKLNFLHILPLSNLVITDESTVSYEALLFNIPTLSVKDWTLQRHRKSIERPIVPVDFAIKIYKKDLRVSILDIIKNLSLYKNKISKLKKVYFENLGKASLLLIEILDYCIKNNKEFYNSKYYVSPLKINLAKFYIKKLIFLIKSIIKIFLPKKILKLLFFKKFF